MHYEKEKVKKNLGLRKFRWWQAKCVSGNQA